MYIIEDSIHIMNMTWLINMKVYMYMYIYIYTIYVYVRLYLYKRSIYTLYNGNLFPEMVLCFLKHRDYACDVVVDDGGGGDAPLHCTSTHLRIDRYHEWKT